MAKLLQNLPLLDPFAIDNGNLDRRWKTYREEIELFLLASGITNDVRTNKNVRLQRPKS